ncbi:MAG: CRISPR system precrRNA processing endoribonuclease RAMP protein Cas6 [Peptostreptococcaceae bacterium]|nr:CRISPR system precrRNA processing endoribonuclease RAMP protein Cas6 [Peptostreptococcaceae bacterium]
MLAKIKFEISGEGLSPNMGSLFHGYLMSIINTSYAEYLHYNSTNPFTSCVYRDRESKKFFWRITTYNKLAYDNLIVPLLDTPERITLEHKNLDVIVKNTELTKTTFDELYVGAPKSTKIRLLTPTSFKSQGMTHIFPDISTLLSGVIKKINTHSDHIKLEDEQILGDLLQSVYIRDYDLRTANFSLESVRIKGFVGTIQPAIRGDRALTSLLHFLIASSEYTGLGIKTSLGMGGVRYE